MCDRVTIHAHVPPADTAYSSTGAIQPPCYSVTEEAAVQLPCYSHGDAMLNVMRMSSDGQWGAVVRYLTSVRAQTYNGISSAPPHTHTPHTPYDTTRFPPTQTSSYMPTQGVHKMANGDMHEGRYEAGKRHGLGVFTSAKGDV